MDQEVQTALVSGNRFFAHVSGKTNNAHVDFVAKFKGVGHVEVPSPEECDYVVIFCPAVSRVGTDIGEALQSFSDDKRIILVVMHHTFNKNLTVGESRRQVNDHRVRLTVDCLFHEGKLHTCNRNDIAWSEIQKCLQVSVSEVTTIWMTVTRVLSLLGISTWKTVCNWLWKKKRLIIIVSVSSVMTIMLISGALDLINTTLMMGYM